MLKRVCPFFFPKCKTTLSALGILQLWWQVASLSRDDNQGIDGMGFAYLLKVSYIVKL